MNIEIRLTRKKINPVGIVDNSASTIEKVVRKASVFVFLSVMQQYFEADRKFAPSETGTMQEIKSIWQKLITDDNFLESRYVHRFENLKTAVEKAQKRQDIRIELNQITWAGGAYWFGFNDVAWEDDIPVEELQKSKPVKADPDKVFEEAKRKKTLAKKTEKNSNPIV